MEDTPSQRLAEKYISLGGTRKSKIDDNIISTRKWDGEPAEAAQFWKDNIEVLSESDKIQVEELLPSINDL